VSGPACGSCTAPFPDGYLCSGCTRDLAMLLLQAASIAGDLDDAVARQLKRGSGGRSSSPEPPLPVDLAASKVAFKLSWTLAWWSSVMHRPGDERPSPTKRDRARWLVVHLDRARQHPDAARMLAEIRDHVHRAETVIDRQPDRVPAGPCQACGTQLLAELGEDMVTCRCGQVTIGLMAARMNRAAAADVLGSAAAISDALKAIGITVPRGTITSWASRGRLLPRPGGAYALSDVLALHAQAKTRVRG
jgi:hypothetical protein